MTSVVERCAALEVRLDSREQNEREEYSAASLDPVKEKLEGVRDGLRRHSSRASVMRVPWPKDRAAGCLTLVAAVRAQLERDAGLLIRRPKFEEMHRSLGSFVRELGRTVDEELETRRSEWLSVREEYLGLLRNIPELEDLCEEALRLREKVASRDDRPRLSDAADLRAICEAGERLLAIRTELDGFDFPDPVRSFLDRAQTPGGAPLAMLVPATREWLEDHGLLPRLRIRLG